ncbi:MAG: UMP kinase [archaeon]
MQVISLGGSTFVSDFIDVDFLKKFRNLVLSINGKKAIFVGGGKTARKYQEALKTVSPETYNLDLIGIKATELNAFLVAKFFGLEKVYKNPNVKFKSKVMVFCGWKPGWSTDYDAVIFAKKNRIKRIINVTNVDYVYDKDPKYPDAKKIEKMSWNDYLKIFGEWKPGMHAPFDPIAARLAQKNKMKVFIVGKDLKNLKKVLNNEPFKGTILF